MAEKFRFLFVLLLIIFMADTSGCGTPKENLIKNPSFEDILLAIPPLGTLMPLIPRGRNLSWNKGRPIRGNDFVTIINNTGNDARYKQSIPVTESKSYHLTAWAKTENIGDKGLGANISIMESVTTSP